MSSPATQRKRQLIKRLARRALCGVEQLADADRADLFEAAAYVLSGDEADAAREAAFTVRQAHQKQLELQDLLNS